MSKELTAQPDVHLSRATPMRLRVPSTNIRAGWGLMLGLILAIVGSIAAAVFLASAFESRLPAVLPLLAMLACGAFVLTPAWLSRWTMPASRSRG
jgi:hypothetical protein